MTKLLMALGLGLVLPLGVQAQVGSVPSASGATTTQTSPPSTIDGKIPSMPQQVQDGQTSCKEVNKQIVCEGGRPRR